MRNIKFRGWDKVNKVMVDWEFLCETLSLEEFSLPEERSDFIFMQFTGLHDKEGRAIYEGDILKYSYSTQDKWIVTWCYDCWILEWEEVHVGDWNMADDPEMIKWDETEVIGNIYENDDLLRGRNK
jgi:uncharacterized phage protein (TIGR01671 family)